MPEKTINSRIVNKHEIEAVWLSNPDFIPMKSEVIMYDRDSTHPFQRMKIGDGVTKIKDLPFVDKDKLHISETKPTFACTWFKVKS